MLSSCLSWFLASLTLLLSHRDLQIIIYEVDPANKLEGKLTGSVPHRVSHLKVHHVVLYVHLKRDLL
jgi:hypothetical protein